VELQPFEAEVGEPGVMGILPAQNLAVACHGAAETEEIVERAPCPLADGGVADGGHHNANVEVAPPHAHVTELVGGLSAQDDVVHNDENGSIDPSTTEVLLLGQKFVDKGLVPLVKKEAFIPSGV